MNIVVEGWFEKDNHLYIARIVEEYNDLKIYESSLFKVLYKKDNKIYMIELPYKSENPPETTIFSNIRPDFINID